MNEMSGFTICNAQSLRLYHQTLKEQILFWIFIAVGDPTTDGADIFFDQAVP